MLQLKWQRWWRASARFIVMMRCGQLDHGDNLLFRSTYSVRRDHKPALLRPNWLLLNRNRLQEWPHGYHRLIGSELDPVRHYQITIVNRCNYVVGRFSLRCRLVVVDVRNALARYCNDCWDRHRLLYFDQLTNVVADPENLVALCRYNVANDVL